MNNSSLDQYTRLDFKGGAASPTTYSSNCAQLLRINCPCHND
jgi:hypothetical protein